MTLTTEAEELILPRGEIMGLEAGMKHHIEALQESLLRLTIFTARPPEAL